MARARRTAAAVALALGVGACGGGTGPLTVPVPTGPVEGAACTTLAQQLPSSLEGRSRRSTKPLSDRVTAWGSPAVVLRCGVVAGNDSTGDHVTVNGVGWRTAGPAHGVVVWITTDRRTGLELTVPDSVNDQETLLADLAPAISRSVSRVPAPASATPQSASPSG